MSFVKTPTSSLTAHELLVKKILYRSVDNLKKCFNRNTPGGSTSCSPPIARLPRELMEIIISYLIYDVDALVACTMTCYSWYIITQSHLHYYLTIDDCAIEDGHWWPRPLQRSYDLGLLPLVRQLCLRNTFDFTLEKFDKTTLRYFSALTNLQELGIDGFQVPSFISDIHRYFGHFAPTLRFLALKDPRGSCRQILYFIGFFSNLQDLKLCYRSCYGWPIEERENTADLALLPLFIPPLCGRLTLTCFTREELVKGMISLFGGLRFRCMDLFRVKCVRLLLHSCAETLETLRLYPTDPYGDSEAVRSNFDLSHNKSLRTLETTAASITTAGGAASGFLTTVLSTITSPRPLDVIIIHREYQVGRYGWDRETNWVGPLSAEQAAEMVREHSERFTVFREMYGGRKFRLVLCADVLDSNEKYATETLERIVEAERKRKGFDFFLGKVLIIADRRSPRIRYRGSCTGGTVTGHVHISAL